MQPFDHIAIIYNPESTGDASRLAEELAQQINEARAKIGVGANLTPTKRAGHAVELARDITLKYPHPLIVSVSGDGGYNEVINGVMQAKEKAPHASPVVAVVGAGNANDHRRVMRSRPLIDLIIENKPKSFDLLHLSAQTDGFTLERYAHSYIGYGVTPQVGHELNRRGKSLLQEVSAILKTYRTYAPFQIERDSTQLTLDNLIFANINEMAKFVKLDDTKTLRDGHFEVIELKHRSKIHMLFTLIKAAVVGFKSPPSYSTYTLTSLKKLPIQLDGEVEWLPANCQATVTSRQTAIDSLF